MQWSDVISSATLSIYKKKGNISIQWKIESSSSLINEKDSFSLEWSATTVGYFQVQINVLFVGKIKLIKRVDFEPDVFMRMASVLSVNECEV
jgi:hypothetical protein